jgi:phosphatidylserine/phosphatidylglycerophosphate/cardiolipin synthase-like enzyme
MARRNRRQGPAIDSCETLGSRQLLAAAVGALAAEVQPLDRAAPPPKAPWLFMEPKAGRTPILDAIDSARHRIRLGICTFDDTTIGDALIAAAARGVNVRVIVDHAGYLTNSAEQGLVASLESAGVSVHLSNSIFVQSFEKDLVIDQRRVLIMTMCLEPDSFYDTTDDGIVLARRDIIGEVTRVFDTDWNHSAAPDVTAPPYNPTPPLRVPDLIWSPVNASARLTALIQKARHTIDATTEWLDDPYLESELIAAVQRGVRVRLILPLTPRNGSSNNAGIALLAENGVQVRVTIGQSPPPDAPYMHAKTMIVDGRIAYLGSIDLQTDATSEDREPGITFQTPTLVARLGAQFRSDWSLATTVPASVLSTNPSAAS